MSTVDHAAYHHNDASAVFDFEDELLYEKCNYMRSVTLQYLPKRLFSKLKKKKKNPDSFGKKTTYQPRAVSCFLSFSFET